MFVLSQDKEIIINAGIESEFGIYISGVESPCKYGISTGTGTLIAKYATEEEAKEQLHNLLIALIKMELVDKNQAVKEIMEASDAVAKKKIEGYCKLNIYEMP